MENKLDNINSPLVSIITPCLNGEKFIHRFLDSVLSQTYNNIELIFINDGSTDKTEEVVLSYGTKFKEKNIDFKYVYQENQGQAAALNQGLKIFKGDYLTWPDSDDILHEDNIADRVSFLENNIEFNIVLCRSTLIDITNNQIGEFKRVITNGEDNAFHDLLIERNIYFAGGAYMIRTSAFIESIPDKHIYESRGGQNWQMLLPVLYQNKCGYIDKYLYQIYARAGSHSRQLHQLSSILSRIDEHEDLLNNVIQTIIGMSNEDKEYYLKIIKEKYARRRFRESIQYKEEKMYKKYYNILKEEGYLNNKDIIYYLFGRHNIFRYTYKIIRMPVRAIKKIKKVLS